MFYYRNIKIWYLLLSLVLCITAEQLTLEEDNLSNGLLVPSNSESIYVGDNGDSEYKYNQDYRYNNDYSDISNNQHSLSDREEREIQEYGDYHEEKEMPNLGKAGLSLFSWWKSEPDAKRSKNGTYPTIASDVTSGANVSITLDPEFLSTGVGTNNNITTKNSFQDSMNISTNSGTNFSTSPAYLTTCYTITLECSPISIPEPAICTQSAINETTTAGGSKGKGTAIADNATAISNQSTGTETTATVLPNTTAIFLGSSLNVSEVMLNSTTEQGKGTTMVMPPTIFNFLSGGMILPVYQLPMTPVVVINSSLSPKSKPIKGMKYHEQPFMQKLTNVSSINELPLHKLHQHSLINDSIMSTNHAEETMSNVSKYEPAFLLDPVRYNNSSKYDLNKIINFTDVNNIISTIDTLNSVATESVYQSAVLNSMEIKNQSSGFLRNNEGSLDGKNLHYAQKTVFKPVQKSGEYCPQILNGRNFNLQKEKDLIMKIPNERLNSDDSNTKASYTKFINQKINSFNSGSLIPELSNSVNENISIQKTNNQLLENEAVHSNENNYFKGCIKYNETYLSEKSNVSANLIALCKNITCKGNDYLAQCCSRMCAPEKCKGEDFFYLHPIPGDTTTVTTTTCCNTISNTSLHRSQIGLQPANILVNCSYTPKQNSRVVRENDLNDFVKFQLMHGMTAPDGKDLINALKEANKQMQKVNREFPSNDLGNIHMNGNDLSVPHLPKVDKNPLLNEQERFVSPLNTNKVLDELRATISNSLFHGNLQSNPLQKERYRIIRNHGIPDQLENIRENNLILEKLKKETEKELKRLSLLEMRRREEEILFEREREKDLKELKTIQELVHREFDSRKQLDSAKRAIPEIRQPSGSEGKESTYSKLVHNIENSVSNNDIKNIILNRFSAASKNTSNSIKPSSCSVDVEQFPELEIKNSASKPHDDTLLVLNLRPDKDSLTGKLSSKRYDFNNEKK